MDDYTKQFFNQHNILVLDTNTRTVRYTQGFMFDDMSNISDLKCVNIPTERLYTVQIPEHNLNSLIELERIVLNGRSIGQHYNIMLNVLHDEFAERNLRKTNEALATAYNNYNTLLHLAGFEKRAR